MLQLAASTGSTVSKKRGQDELFKTEYRANCISFSIFFFLACLQVAQAGKHRIHHSPHCSTGPCGSVTIIVLSTIYSVLLYYFNSKPWWLARRRPISVYGDDGAHIPNMSSAATRMPPHNGSMPFLFHCIFNIAIPVRSSRLFLNFNFLDRKVAHGGRNLSRPPICPMGCKP